VYYVALNYPPYWKDRIHESDDLEAAKAWASKEARERGVYGITVRQGPDSHANYGHKFATYDNQGQEA